MSLLHYLTWTARRKCRKRIDHFRFRCCCYYCHCCLRYHCGRGRCPGEYGHWRAGRSCVSCQSHPKGVWHPWLRRELKKACPCNAKRDGVAELREVNGTWMFYGRLKIEQNKCCFQYYSSDMLIVYSLHQDKRGESREAPLCLNTFRRYVTSKLWRKILLAIFSFDGRVAIFFHQFHGIDEITHVFG